MMIRLSWPIIALLLLCASRVAFAQAPGTLISADEMHDAPAQMRAWRITYWTYDQDNRPHQVTGTVVAPSHLQASGTRRVIAWAHGTWGVMERCVPTPINRFFEVTPALGEMIRRGFTVVAPDYPGLGSSMPHPYLVGVDTARSVLDAVRAARAIPEAASGPQFAVWGESQGGHAALWTAAVAREYAPELTLLATAAAAPPTDLNANLRQGSDKNIRAMLASYATYSWSQRFDAPLSTLFNRTNAGVVTRLAENNCVELGKDPRIGTILGLLAVRNALARKDMTRIKPWSEIASKNSVVAGKIPGPLLIAQSLKDSVVAPSVTLAFAKDRCRAGGALRYISLTGGDHATTSSDTTTQTLDWIEALFAGQKTPDDCPAVSRMR